MSITDPAMATTVAMRQFTTVMARPPITGADHIITADTDIAPAFPVSAVIRWPAGNSRVRNRPQGSPVPSPPAADGAFHLHLISGSAALSVFMGSGRSQSKHFNVRCPLPPGDLLMTIHFLPPKTDLYD